MDLTYLTLATAAGIAFLLWHKLHIPKTTIDSVIGDTAYVGSQGVTKQKGGEVTWSGTIIKAQLAKDAPLDKLEAGAPVTVAGISGTSFIVEPQAQEEEFA